MLIRAVNTYFGPQGEKIEELPLIDAETGMIATDEQMKELTEEEPKYAYFGVLQIPVGVSIPGPNGPIMIDVRPQDVRFQIEAASRKDAFEKFAAGAELVLADLKKKQEEQESKRNEARRGIIVPNAAQSEAINKLKLVTEE